MYGTDNLLELLYKQTQQNNKTLLNCKENELDKLLKEKRFLLRDKLKIDFYENFNFTPILNKIETSTVEGHKLEKYDAEILNGFIFPLYVITPKIQKNKVIFYCNGHNKNGCISSFIRTEEEKKLNNSIPLKMAELGYTVVIPEFAGYGQMAMQNYENFNNESSNLCYANAANLLMYGLNLAGLRVFQAMKTLDLLYDKFGFKEIALYGISGGGIVASYTCALDSRINAGIITCYPNIYKESIMSRRHCICNYVPDILAVGECPEIISLAVPMPILVSNGNKDQLFPVNGTIKTIEQISNIYSRFNAQDNFMGEIFDGGHQAHFEKVLDFLNKYL